MAFRSRTGHVHGVNDEQQKERKVYIRSLLRILSSFPFRFSALVLIDKGNSI